MRTSGGAAEPAEEDENEENLDDAGDSEDNPMQATAAFRVFRKQVNQKTWAIESDLGKLKKRMRVDVDKISEKLDLIVRAVKNHVIW